MDQIVTYPRPIRTNSMSRPGVYSESIDKNQKINLDQISQEEIEQDFMKIKSNNADSQASNEIMNILCSPKPFDSNSSIKESEMQKIRKENNSKKNYNYYSHETGDGK